MVATAVAKRNAGKVPPRVRTAALLARSRNLLRKTYDPNQPRDEDGQWTDSGGGHSNLPLKDREWKTMNTQQKQERLSELYVYLGATAQHSNIPFERQQARGRLDRLNALSREDNAEHRMLQSAGDYHESLRLANRAKQQQQQEGALAGDVAAEVIRNENKGNNNQQQNFVPQLQDTARLPSGWKRTTAELSAKVATVARGATNLLRLAAELAGDRAPESLGAATRTLSAVTQLSASINGLTRANDLPTATASVRGANKAAQRLTQEINTLRTSQVGTGAKAEIDRVLASTKQTLADAERTLAQSKIVQAANRAQFSAGGGRIATAPARTIPKSILYSPSVPKTVSHIAPKAMTSYTPPTRIPNRTVQYSTRMHSRPFRTT